MCWCVSSISKLTAGRPWLQVIATVYVYCCYIWWTMARELKPRIRHCTVHVRLFSWGVTVATGLYPAPGADKWSHHVRTAQDMGQCAQPALHPSMQLRGCLPAVCSLSFTTCIVRAPWSALLRPRRVTRSQPPARSPLQRLGGVAAARAYRDERAELPA